ncbi:MAG: DUF4282 domain-containing protein [Alphaproteobacteria bacterium]|nr:DUF4282 domain-containing protein [Alphaproteobacteria bacterium]
MTLDDFAKFLNRTFLLSLDRINGPGIVRLVYLLGLAVAAIWGLNHFFATFRTGFGDGLWGILEIVVFGLFGLGLLRVVCEALIVYFEANKDAMRSASRAAIPVNLIDEVRDAIEQLGEDDKEARAPARAAVPARPAVADTSAATAKARAPAKSSAAKASSAKPATTLVAPVKRTPRTAKRSPGSKAGAGEG